MTDGDALPCQESVHGDISTAPSQEADEDRNGVGRARPVHAPSHLAATQDGETGRGEKSSAPDRM